MSVFLGIDVAATKPIALAACYDLGWDVRVSSVSRLRGGQRLAAVRTSVIAQLESIAGTAGVPYAVAVEIPFSTAKTFVLPSVAAVCCEAVGALFPDCVVIEAYAQKWRKAVLGRGNLKTAEAKELALEKAALHGLRTSSDDVAEAACLALYAKAEWERAVAA